MLVSYHLSFLWSIWSDTVCDYSIGNEDIMANDYMYRNVNELIRLYTIQSDIDIDAFFAVKIAIEITNYAGLKRLIDGLAVIHENWNEVRSAQVGFAETLL